MKVWGRTLLNSLLSTVPVIAIVAILNFTNIASFSKVETLHGNGLVLFIVGSFLLFFGVAFFSIGTENAMSKIGEYVGSSLTSKRNITALVLITLLLGIFVTIAEPDLSVLSSKLFSGSGNTMYFIFIGLVGLGVGIFLVIGVLRILFQKSLKVWLLAFYALLFSLLIFAEEAVVPVTFDSGGVTTGPVTVPFILALGVGIATSRAGKSSHADSFGLTAFCSVGPILVVLIFGIIVKKFDTTVEVFEVTNAWERFNHSLVSSIKNVALAMSPIIIFFFIYNALVIHLPKQKILKIITGLAYTFVGLVLFLTGAEGGFTPIADGLGKVLLNRGINENLMYVLLIVAGLIGFVVVLCEPAVQVLVKQVEEVSDGLIKKKTMLIALSIGIAIAVILAIIRIIYKFPIYYYIVPGYILAFILSFCVPDIYVGIAFDSGGVASGPMTSAFIMPFALGVGKELYKLDPSIAQKWTNETTFIMTQAFGTVALVALMPLIVIQLLGLNATFMRISILRDARHRVMDANDNQIIHFGE